MIDKFVEPNKAYTRRYAPRNWNLQIYWISSWRRASLQKHELIACGWFYPNEMVKNSGLLGRYKCSGPRPLLTFAGHEA